MGPVAINDVIPFLIVGDVAIVIVVGLMLIDNLWSPFESRNQTLHDEPAVTIVVTPYTPTG